MIGPCKCEHPSQDEIYGKGMRLFNERLNNRAPRCTVCGRDAPGYSGSTPKKSK